MQSLNYALQLIGIVEGNPAVSLIRVGLQKPPLGCTGAICNLNDGEYTLSGKHACSAIVRSRASADVQIING